MLSLEFWELHEALFILSEWPENVLAIKMDSHISRNIGRDVIYAAKSWYAPKKTKNF